MNITHEPLKVKSHSQRIFHMDPRSKCFPPIFSMDHVRSRFPPVNGCFPPICPGELQICDSVNAQKWWNTMVKTHHGCLATHIWGASAWRSLISIGDSDFERALGGSWRCLLLFLDGVDGGFLSHGGTPSSKIYKTGFSLLGSMFTEYWDS